MLEARTPTLCESRSDWWQEHRASNSMDTAPLSKRRQYTLISRVFKYMDALFVFCALNFARMSRFVGGGVALCY